MPDLTVFATPECAIPAVFSFDLNGAHFGWQLMIP
jgi:hypothetical protein